jgi:hypothetical protein
VKGHGFSRAEQVEFNAGALAPLGQKGGSNAALFLAYILFQRIATSELSS